MGRLDAIGQQSEPEEISVEELLQKCGLAACALHKRDPATTMVYHVPTATIVAQRLVVESVFRNLIDNAIKYGGDPPVVEIDVRLTDRGHVVTRISDNGEGVPPELRKRIFGLFFRAGSELTRRKKGTGLGLYIVYVLVRHLKGRISVHDRVGQSGTVFEIDLPGGATV